MFLCSATSAPIELILTGIHWHSTVKLPTSISAHTFGGQQNIFHELQPYLSPQNQRYGEKHKTSWTNKTTFFDVFRPSRGRRQTDDMLTLLGYNVAGWTHDFLVSIEYKKSSIIDKFLINWILITTKTEWVTCWQYLLTVWPTQLQLNRAVFHVLLDATANEQYSLPVFLILKSN